MKKNPMLKSDDRVIKMYGNTAILRYVNRVRTYDDVSGVIADSTETVERTVSVSGVDILANDVPNGKGYLAGDAFFEVSRLELERNIPDFRTVSAKSCGICPESDVFIISGTEYRIVKITPLNEWANTPARYKFHCRTNGGDE